MGRAGHERVSAVLHKAPPPGTPLKCALAGGLLAEAAHSGVYLGGGCVAELRGDGVLAAVTLSAFLNGVAGEWDLAALRTGFRIYAACDAASGRTVASAAAAERARRIAGGAASIRRVHYDWRERNCHRFTAGCVTGRFGGDGTGGMWMLDRLEAVIAQSLNGGRPIVWRAVSPGTPGFRYAPTLGKQLQKRLLADGALGLLGLGLGIGSGCLSGNAQT